MTPLPPMPIEPGKDPKELVNAYARMLYGRAYIIDAKIEDDIVTLTIQPLIPIEHIKLDFKI